MEKEKVYFRFTGGDVEDNNTDENERECIKAL